MSKLERKFKIGALVLDDPNPSISINEVQEIHSKLFPQVRFTTIFNSDGQVGLHEEKTVLMFEYILPPVSVNG